MVISGGATRAVWMAVGGFVFFGAFEFMRIVWLRQAHGSENIHVKHFGIYDGGYDFLTSYLFSIGGGGGAEKRETFDERIKKAERIQKISKNLFPPE